LAGAAPGEWNGIDCYDMFSDDYRRSRIMLATRRLRAMICIHVGVPVDETGVMPEMASEATGSASAVADCVCPVGWALVR
jgi:hypothetical protein